MEIGCSFRWQCPPQSGWWVGSPHAASFFFFELF
jgi:hypothetical protein